MENSWKKRLLMARAQWFLKNYQAAKDHGVPAPAKYDDRTSNGLRKCVLDWLKFHYDYYNLKSVKGKVISSIIEQMHVTITIKSVRFSQSELKEVNLIKAKSHLSYSVNDMESFVEFYESIKLKENSLKRVVTT